MNATSITNATLFGAVAGGNAMQSIACAGEGVETTVADGTGFRVARRIEHYKNLWMQRALAAEEELEQLSALNDEFADELTEKDEEIADYQCIVAHLRAKLEDAGINV